MNIIPKEVPTGISKLSMWEGFKDIIPEGKCIINKKVTGCGATTYFLDHNNPTPIVLCSHRTELLACKARAPRHKDHVHLFKDANDRTIKDLERNMKALRDYLDSCYPDPFFGRTKVPKILVTTDSLHHVLDILEDRGELQYFTVVSDEMQCIFTDAVFKGNEVLKYLNCLDRVKNVIFLSATPYLVDYLDQIPEFKDLPYIELVWPTEMIDEVNMKSFEVTSLRKTALDKIKFYLQNGYFEENYSDRATQGVFFFNSVSEIVSIIRSLGLTKDITNVICSRSNPANKKKLKKVGIEIGEAQQETEIHKPITFITKCSFEGVDLYHPNAYTYIFSDPNLDNLSVDLSIDLPQILGRQRLKENPWRACATIYYQTTKDGKKETVEDFNRRITTRDNFTFDYIKKINNNPDKGLKDGYIEMVKTADKVKPFAVGYISIDTDPLTGNAIASHNNLVRMSEIRAWDIRQHSYDDSYCVIAGIEGLGVKISNQEFLDFEAFFTNPGHDFVERLKRYCEYREAHSIELSEILGSPLISKKYHEYYDLGVDTLSACSYQESKIKAYLETKRKTESSDLKDQVYLKFKVGDKLTNKFIKNSLQDIYVSLGLDKKAKATDLDEWFETKTIKVTGPGNKRANGVELISIKQ